MYNPGMHEMHTYTHIMYIYMCQQPKAYGRLLCTITLVVYLVCCVPDQVAVMHWIHISVLVCHGCREDSKGIRNDTYCRLYMQKYTYR